jgi:hypothetical protein
LSGFGLEDGDSASSLMVQSAIDPIDRNLALFAGYTLALNRGRPQLAHRLLRRRRDMESSDDQFWHYSVLAGVYQDGDSAAAIAAVRGRESSLQRDTVPPLPRDADSTFRLVRAMSGMASWYLRTGDTARARAATDWLRRQSTKSARYVLFSVVPEMVIASLARSREAPALRARVDSMTLSGCCGGGWTGMLDVAAAYERNGDLADALRVLRRGAWYWPPRNLPVFLRHEGRLAARLGDRAGAIRAYEHYHALRSDPEPRLRADRDSVRAELRRLRGR